MTEEALSYATVAEDHNSHDEDKYTQDAGSPFQEEREEVEDDDQHLVMEDECTCRLGD